MNNEREIIEEATNKAYKLYGNPLPKQIEERLNIELKYITKDEHYIIYTLTKKLVEKSNEKGYLVSNRGSIGSSFVAYLLGITQTNPVSKKYGGFNIPFTTLAGVNFDKPLDIKLNVAQECYKDICKYLDQILINENMNIFNGNIEKNKCIFRRVIQTPEGKIIGNIDIMTHSLLSVLKQLHELTNDFPQKILKKDINKIVDFLIKNEFYFGADLENILDVISKVKITSIESIAILIGLLYGTGRKNSIEDMLEYVAEDTSQIISSKDDIMLYLIQKDIDIIMLYDIMENISKGKGLTTQMEITMIKKDIPTWYIRLCRNISYLFPKAHNAGYAITICQLAWYGIYYPNEYAQVIKKLN